MVYRWGSDEQSAFDSLKKSLTSAPTLAFFDYNKQIVLETDASDWASGGVLSQYDDNKVLRPVAYFSSKHNAAECNYEIYDTELLAIIKCLEEWHPEFQGTQNSFKVLTDHKNLEYFKTSKVLSQRQVRWSEFLSQFNFQIVYRPGVKATRPDALSRKSEDRPNKFDGDDDRVKNRERTVLPVSRFDSNELDNLLQFKWSSSMYFPNAIKTSNPTHSFKISLVPETDLPIDELIDRAYARNNLARAMIECLKNVECGEWNRDIRKSLKIAFSGCKVI
ncbi:hypothetical protein K3495_g8016 [Podosphaera aphanis]|nr:hypothetical protein K3495_g8016 [Podosphaera aphanis]